MKTIGVILPDRWFGEMLDSARTFCRLLMSFNERYGETFTVVLGLLENAYDKNLVESLEEEDIKVRFLQWRTYTQQDLKDLKRTKPTNTMATEHDEESIFPITLLDCDVLIFYGLPDQIVAPLKPYAVFAADWLQRIVPTNVLFGTDLNHPRWMWVLKTMLSCRQAALCYATTPKTYEDCISYAGIPRARVRLLPIVTELPSSVQENKDDKSGTLRDGLHLPYPFVLWATNDMPNNNHLVGLEALQLYYRSYGGRLNVIMCGRGVEGFLRADSGNEYTNLVCRAIQQHEGLQERLRIIGNIPAESYCVIKKEARFWLHNVIYDSGCGALIEAAEGGTPVLSSRYPQAEFVNQRFGVRANYFDPYDPDDLARKLKQQEDLKRSSVTPLSTSVEVSEPYYAFIKDLLAA